MITVTRRGVSFNVTNESPSLEDFWSWDSWEAATYECLDNYLDKEHSYLDIGCHLGQTILYGCQKAKHCYAVDPDPESIRITKENLTLNSFNNITVVNAAMGLDEGLVKLGTPDNLDLGGSRTGSYFTQRNSFLSNTLSVSTFIDRFNITDLNFIKIDVEGMEDKIVEGCGDLTIPMHLSLHTCWLSKGKEGYNNIIRQLSKYSQLYLETNSWVENSLEPITIEELTEKYTPIEEPSAFFSIVAL